MLSETQVAQAVSTVLATSTASLAISHSDSHESPELAFETTIHQLHAAFGRLQGHVSDLKAHLRYHQRLLLRLEAIQGKVGDQRDELLPAYVLQLFAQPKTALELHLRVLAQRCVVSIACVDLLGAQRAASPACTSVKILEDEKLLYKWVNSLVASYPAAESESLSTGRLADTFPALHAQVSSAHTLFQANAAAFQQLSECFELEWRKWKREKRQAQLQQMETKMERVAQEVRARELFDPHKLFAQSAQSWAKQQQQLTATSNTAAANSQPLPHEQELESLRRQLEQVIREIATEHCSAQLR